MKRNPLKHNVGNHILLKPVPMIKQIFCEIQHDLRHLVTGKKSVKLQLRFRDWIVQMPSLSQVQ